MRAGEIVVFLGPSLPVEEARRTLRAQYLPPVCCGDVLRVRRIKPRVIAIIDGLFETTAAVWHKEILLALEDGIAVFGASSMGALRAAELAPFGMVGVGKIFEAYREGLYTDDDEVALLHGTAAHGHRALSEAMVNIRATVARAVEAGVIGSESGERVIRCAKETFYQERSLAGAIDQAWGTRARGEEATRFRRFIARGGYVNQKRLDALALVRQLAGMSPKRVTSQNGAAPVNRSYFILKLQHEVMCRPFTTADPGLPGEEQVALEARLLGSTYRLLRRLAQLMSVAHALARAQALAVSPRDLTHVYERDDFGLGPSARTRRWAQVRDLDDKARRCFVERLADIRALLEASEHKHGGRETRRSRYEVYLLALMRIDGRYTRWRPSGNRTGASVDRAVLRNAERRDGMEFRLYRRIAKLWRVVDEAATRVGMEPLDEPQLLSDEFRRARGLNLRESTRVWLRANNLDSDGYTALIAADARLSILCDNSRTYTLGLIETADPVCWLHDAIRLTRLYPSLKRRLARAPATDGRSRQAPGGGVEQTIFRRHFARLGEPVPTNIEEYACSLDFINGETEFQTALEQRRGRAVSDNASTITKRSLPRSVRSAPDH